MCGNQVNADTTSGSTIANTNITTMIIVIVLLVFPLYILILNSPLLYVKGYVNMHIPFFFLIILFVIWLGYETRKNTKNQVNDSKRFWERESDALMTPRKPVDDVNFIEIPEDVIPAVIEKPSTDAEREINELTGELKALQSKKIADLSEFTNTDLRLKYGVPNFTMLMDADTNFSRLVQFMPLLIGNLLEAGHRDEAGRLLEFCNSNGIKSGAISRLADECKD